MKNNMENYRYYQSKGLINKDQLTNQVALYYQQQNNLLSLSGQNEQNALQITTLESQIQTQAADFDNRIYQMELQRLELQKELVNTDVEGEIIIRALSDGKVDSECHCRANGQYRETAFCRLFLRTLKTIILFSGSRMMLFLIFRLVTK